MAKQSLDNAASQIAEVTPLFGKAGDLTSVSESDIVISQNCTPAGDVLHELPAGTPVSLLGIDLNKRIRHCINGVANVSAE